MKRATIAVLLVLSVVHVPASGARQEQSERVSRELVERLLAGYGGFGRMTIVEGVPREFPASLIPEGAVARMTARSPSMTLVLVEAERFAPEDRPRYERQLAAAGWSASARGGMRRGLAMSASEPAAMFCRDGEHLTYAASPARGGGWWVHVSTMKFGGRTSCDEPSRGQGPMRSVFDDARMPALAPPETSRVVSMSGGGGDDHQEQQIHLETRLSAEDVAEHYLAQLSAHGWTTDARASVEGITIVRLSAPLGPNDKPIPATISTMAMADGAVTVTFRIFAPPRWRP